MPGLRADMCILCIASLASSLSSCLSRGGVWGCEGERTSVNAELCDPTRDRDPALPVPPLVEAPSPNDPLPSKVCCITGTEPGTNAGPTVLRASELVSMAGDDVKLLDSTFFGTFFGTFSATNSDVDVLVGDSDPI